MLPQRLRALGMHHLGSLVHGFRLIHFTLHVIRKINKYIAHAGAKFEAKDMDAKDAAMAAKRYFEDTKSIRKFIFETVSVKKDSENWIVICLVQDLFDEEGKKFKIIANNDGEILDVEMIDQSPR